MIGVTVKQIQTTSRLETANKKLIQQSQLLQQQNKDLEQSSEKLQANYNKIDTKILQFKSQASKINTELSSMDKTQLQPIAQKPFKRSTNKSIKTRLDSPETKKMLRQSYIERLKTDYALFFAQLNLLPEVQDAFINTLTEEQLLDVKPETPPEEKEAIRKQLQANFEKEYARYMELHHYTSQQKEAFINKIVERELEFELSLLPQKKLDQKIKSILGDIGFHSYEKYKKIIPSIGIINELRDRLAYTQIPLQDYQAQQLLQIFTQEEEKRERQAKDLNNKDTATSKPFSTEHQLKELADKKQHLYQQVANQRSSLSAEQIKVFVSILEERLDGLDAVPDLIRSGDGITSPATSSVSPTK